MFSCPAINHGWYGIHSIDLHSFYIVPLASQLHPPPHGPVMGCTATYSTFNCLCLGFKLGSLDFRDLTKHA
eukprot:11256286-Ditylum_brightwellii.AAC.1